jgi:hypothetical protein
MSPIKQWKYLLTCLNRIVAMFMVVSFVFVVFSVLNSHFYSSISLIITFGTGGIFTAAFSYYDSFNQAVQKNEVTRWSIILTMILIAMIFFVFLAPIQKGEYEDAFKSFGTTLAFSSLMFFRGKLVV